MPGKVGVKIKAARNLPVMDKSSETTDAFVEIKLASVTHKTDVFRKSLNPTWNTDWFRFEVDDAELQDEPLQIRLMDYDTYSANDAIGKVNISLNPLCLESSSQAGHGKGSVLSGWIPVFDTMHGIRGEINVIVKVDLFSDVNKFRQSSCGIPFFHSQCVPFGYRAQVIHGFVEELVVNDDPEYQWIDKIRTPRASNEARQVVFLKLSGQVQRKMGLKAINLGANAVIGYTQCFDLEGDVGVVARGVGTAVTLIKDTSSSQPNSADVALIEESSTEIQQQPSVGTTVTDATAIPVPVAAITSNTESPNAKRFASPVNTSRLKLTPSPSKSGISATTNADSASTSTTSTATTMVPTTVGEICRRSSDSDLSVTPKGNSICVASERLVAATAMMRLSQPVAKTGAAADTLDMLEYPFLTMTKYPTGFILHLGATVAARSVKLLERVPNPDEPEVRDSWWTELRMEIRSHARSLGCNVVLGYAETTTISDDVCVLSATGTAAVINMVFNRSISQTDIFAISKAATTLPPGAMSTSLEERDANGSEPSVSKESGSTSGAGGSSTGKRYGLPPLLNGSRNTCAICHIPYNLSSVPFNVKMKKCAVCRKGRVPDVLLATLEVPEYLQVTGRGCFMQAQVVRSKRDLRSELNAKEISDGLPFLEYELHRVLINKLKAKGMNAIFGLRTQVAIGERMIALIATGTALFLTALPVPQVPKIVAGNSWTDKQKLNELQKKLQETFERNQEIYQLKSMDPDLASAPGTAATAQNASGDSRQSESDDSDEEEMNEIDLNCGNKELCVLEVDDIEDLEIISLLMEPYPPEGFHVVNTQSVPGMQEMDTVKNLQMFTQVWRARLDVGQSVNGFPKHFQRLLQTIYFKLRTMIPCAICDLRFRLDLPETDQIQLLVTGMAMGLTNGNKMKYRRRQQQQQNGLHEVATIAAMTVPPQSLIMHPTQSQPELNGKRQLQEEDYIFPLDEDQMVDTPTPTSSAIPPFGMSSFKMRKTSPSRLGNLGNLTPGLSPAATAQKSLNAAQIPRNRFFPLRDRFGVDLTPLSFIPGGRIEKYLGNLNFFFIRESTSIRENGGISGFVHGFITELLAVVRAHIASVGGNAMVSFYITELILFDNQHKNQGQCLISIGGDAVYVSYYADD
ncbi:C2 domain-containing protein 5 isoform X2 [Drosophila tropicalis]|uniref:C2 domain-containing protein 5 isoform X2 n=1 Tax=Drosophila tropicalis TaxID=46794 RepID=UPI0035ABF91C